MGSFSFTCAVSRLAIESGPVRFLLVTSSPSTDVVSSPWFQRTFAIRAEYNTYGTITNAEEGPLRDLIQEGFQIDLVSRGTGNNPYHDLPTSKTMSWEILLETLRADRVLVEREVHQAFPSIKLPKDLETPDLIAAFKSFEPRKKPKTPDGVPTMQRVRRVLVQAGLDLNDFLISLLKFATVCVRISPNSTLSRTDYLSLCKVQKLLNGTYATMARAGRRSGRPELLVCPKPGTPNFHGYDGTRDRGPKLRVRPMMIREDVWQALLLLRSGRRDRSIDEYREDMYKLYKTGRSDFLALSDEVPFTVALGTHWRLLRDKELRFDKVKPALDQIAEHLRVAAVLRPVRVPFEPSSSYGPQFGCWSEHTEFFDAMFNVAQAIEVAQDDADYED